MIIYIKALGAGIVSTALSSSTPSLILKFIILGWLFFAGIHVYIYAIFALTLIDVVTGVIASRNRNEPFSSRKFKKGLLEKTFFYILILVVVFILDFLLIGVIGHSTFYLAFGACFSISLYEVSSILENIYSVNPEFTFLKRLLNLTGTIEEKFYEKAEAKIDATIDEVLAMKEASKGEKPDA